MKKILTLLLAALMLFVVTACGNTNAAQSEPSGSPVISSDTQDSAPATNSPKSTEAPASSENEATQPSEDEAGGTSILVAYFSRAGENHNVGVIEKGNTAIIAEMIAEETNGDLFEIRRVTPYPEAYRECTDEAQQEKSDNARPELTATVDHFSDYDVIFLGYPNWWGDMPMPVYTFLESYDFSGKIIVPFATHEGSGLSSTESSIASICSGADVLGGLAIRGTVAQNSQDEAKDAVVNWLREGGFIE